MARDSEGRRAGHHLTRGQGWRWQSYGGQLMLVTDGGGGDVVLSSMAGGPRKGALASCSPEGRMEPIKADHPLALLLAAVPDLAAIAQEIEGRDDRPNYLPKLRAALAKAGLA